jgi:DNA-binding transcriptional MerR regulator
MELKERIQELREKGMTVREIKEILNISYHDIYEDKADPKIDPGQRPSEEEEEDPRLRIEIIEREKEREHFREMMAKAEAEINQLKGEVERLKEANRELSKFKNDIEETNYTRISKKATTQELEKEQELCLKELRSHIEKPFRDRQEWEKWKNNAYRLQLNQWKEKDYLENFGDNWMYLLQGSPLQTNKDRQYLIDGLERHLKEMFANARRELQFRRQ